MGEHAEEYFRADVKRRFGFDPGPQDAPSKKKKKDDKVRCEKCGRRVKQAGIKDHIRDVHGANND